MNQIEDLALYFELKSLLVRRMNSLQRYDINKTCEYFYARLLNILRGYKLVNKNNVSPNCPGIDLIDEDAEIIIQVSSESKKQKIQDALNKSQIHKNFHFYFISIAKDIKQQRKSVYKNENLIFNSHDDILDDRALLSELEGMPERAEEVKELFRQFFPWLKNWLLSQDEDKQYFEADRRMLLDFFEYFSCNYMDEFLQNPEKLRYEFCGSYDCWYVKWGMSSTYFMDNNIDSLMRTFWEKWINVMEYEEYYSDEDTDTSVHFLKGWFKRHQKQSEFNNNVYRQILNATAELKSTYEDLIRIIQSRYKMNLANLSEKYEQLYIKAEEINHSIRNSKQ